jgi:hypothetical protein
MYPNAIPSFTDGADFPNASRGGQSKPQFYQIFAAIGEYRPYHPI